jgi:SNF2 family DNA or RNA helicase
MLDKRKIKYSRISGEVKDRQSQVTAFQADADVKVMVGQIQTIGLGLTLTAASTMVFYSENYSMSDFEQTKARIHRNGQAEPCTFLFLAAKGTVDEQVLKALRDKADLAKALVDNYKKGGRIFG